MVMLGALAYAEGGDAGDLVRLPRFHHQYLPDTVFYESQGFDANTVEALQKRGHLLKKQKDGYGNMQSIVWEKNTGQVNAASDARGIGQAQTLP